MLRRSFAFMLVGVVVTMLAIPPAAAQEISVTTEQAVRLTNGTECAAGNEAVISVGAQAAAPTPSEPIGTTITDEQGHFDYIVPAGSLPVGSLSLVVECGADTPLIFDVVVAEATVPLWQQTPVLLAVGGVVVLAAAVLVLRSRKAGKSGDDSDDAAVDATPAPEPAADADADDGAEYWVWEHSTEQGELKRVACLTDQAFYLHELDDDAFPALLDTIQDVGPDAGLAGAHYRFFVGDIGEVARRGHLIRLTSKAGQAQVIDVGSAAKDVFSMLRRRLGDSVCHEISVPAGV